MAVIAACAPMHLVAERRQLHPPTTGVGVPPAAIGNAADAARGGGPASPGRPCEPDGNDARAVGSQAVADRAGAAVPGLRVDAELPEEVVPRVVGLLPRPRQRVQSLWLREH